MRTLTPTKKMPRLADAMTQTKQLCVSSLRDIVGFAWAALLETPSQPLLSQDL